MPDPRPTVVILTIYPHDKMPAAARAAMVEGIGNKMHELMFSDTADAVGRLVIEGEGHLLEFNSEREG